MKLIDEKGKLFGKVNIVDLVVLLLIVALVGAVGYKALGPKVAVSPNAEGKATFVVKLAVKPEKWMSALKPGDQLVYGTSFVNAYIENIVSQPGELSAVTADGESVISVHPTLKDIYVTINAKVNANDAILKVGTQELALGKKFTLKTQKFEIDGTVDSLTLEK